ncbi:hypothetical protein BAY61_07400 [Prauserella marina]|uniref:Uncharacterized protein n=1 Tax=Prauserella marina TaxID=530584 RepID=A0A222VLN0_9PSEU|nr:hypothetical protein BAY61_07400 [Prauserella marina]PWV85477.1 hypothetical protein DES30_1011504 [Prauserella marina]SDC53894.1 hypothetical protein SAMN05421630_102487 [Prauserella marina]
MDDEHVHYRPKDHRQPGTTLTVSAKIYGIDFGDTIYGSTGLTETDRVHDSWVAKTDGNTASMTISTTANR